MGYSNIFQYIWDWMGMAQLWTGWDAETNWPCSHSGLFVSLSRQVTLNTESFSDAKIYFEQENVASYLSHKYKQTV